MICRRTNLEDEEDGSNKMNVFKGAAWNEEVLKDRMWW